jgi:hypothetical protein
MSAPAMNHDHELLKAVLDWIAASLTVAAFVSWLPPIVTLLTGIWTVTRLYEAITGKLFSNTRIAKWLTGRKH